MPYQGCTTLLNEGCNCQLFIHMTMPNRCGYQCHYANRGWSGEPNVVNATAEPCIRINCKKLLCDAQLVNCVSNGSASI